MFGAPRLPAMDAVLTMAASAEARKPASAAWVIRKTPFTFTAKMCSHCRSVNCSMGPLSTTPALFTNTVQSAEGVQRGLHRGRAGRRHP